MAKLLQLRGGTTSQHSSFTGAVREVTVDTDKDILVVHDGSTAGGFPAHRDLKGSDISSADPLVIVAGSNYFIVTGTTGFNDMTVAANTHFFLEFAGALVMTHVGGALDLPSGAAITTAAGDVGEFFSTAANVVTCVNYTRASGKALVTDVVLDTSPTLGGELAGQDNIVSRVNLKDYGEVTNAIGSIGGGTQDIDLTLGNSVSGTVDTSTTTFTFSNPTASDELCAFSLMLTAGSSQSVVWPSTVDWAGGTAPTLSATVDCLVFWTVDGGAIWNGSTVALNLS